MKLQINYKRKRIRIKNVKRCVGINRFIGLMFKNRSTNALLFEFSSLTNVKIHSLFCKPFIAIWLDKNNTVTEIRVINHIGIYSPKTKFFKLLELPLNKNYIPVIKNLLGKEKV
jgi:uncharacterized membrane protein (UPF0127 family)